MPKQKRQWKRKQNKTEVINEGQRRGGMREWYKAPERASLKALSCYDVGPEVTSKLATHTSFCQGGGGHRNQAALHSTQRQQ